MIIKARKKPTEIDAIQWYGKKPIEIEAVQWVGELPLPEEFLSMGYLEYENGYDLSIETLEGQMRCRLGDYIIKGISGEFYLCKPDIFEKTYDILD